MSTTHPGTRSAPRHFSTRRTLRSDRLSAIVMEQGVKLTWLARAINVSSRTVSRWLAGDTRQIEAHNLARLAEVLSVPTSFLAESAEADTDPKRLSASAHGLLKENTVALMLASRNLPGAERIIGILQSLPLTHAQTRRLYADHAMVDLFAARWADAMMRATAAWDHAWPVQDLPVLANAALVRGTILAREAAEGALDDLAFAVEHRATMGSWFQHVALYSYAIELDFLGEWDRAYEIVSIPVEYGEVASEFDRAFIWGLRSQIQASRGNWVASLEAAHESIRLLRHSAPSNVMYAMSRLNRAEAEVGIGQVGRGLATLDELLSADFTLGPSAYAKSLPTSAARIYRRAGLLDRAHYMLARQAESMPDTPARRYLFWRELYRTTRLRGDQTTADIAHAQAAAIRPALPGFDRA